MDNNHMSRIQRHQKKNWLPFSQPVQQMDSNLPAEIANVKFNCKSGFPRYGNVTIGKLSDGSYHFSGKGVDPNQRYVLNHFYWNGYKTSERVVKPQKTIVKTKHGITRGVVGDMVGGLPGGILGATTASKETTHIDAKKQELQDPLNAFIDLTNIDNGQHLRVEMELMFTNSPVLQFEKQFQLSHEVEYFNY